MREIRSYGSVGVPAGNRRHYPEVPALKRRAILKMSFRDKGTWYLELVPKAVSQSLCRNPLSN